MSKFTVEEVEKYSKLAKHSIGSEAAEMLRDLARRLRQEEEEAKRDPVHNPRPGDRVTRPGYPDTMFTGGIHSVTFNAGMAHAASCNGATIIRRREVQR